MGRGRASRACCQRLYCVESTAWQRCGRRQAVRADEEGDPGDAVGTLHRLVHVWLQGRQSRRSHLRQQKLRRHITQLSCQPKTRAGSWVEAHLLRPAAPNRDANAAGCSGLAPAQHCVGGRPAPSAMLRCLRRQSHCFAAIELLANFLRAPHTMLCLFNVSPMQCVGPQMDRWRCEMLL